eukprot:scaffold111429_cov18-Tisochrysis_lutea.AAC.2
MPLLFSLHNSYGIIGCQYGNTIGWIFTLKHCSKALNNGIAKLHDAQNSKQFICCMPQVYAAIGSMMDERAAQRGYAIDSTSGKS